VLLFNQQELGQSYGVSGTNIQTRYYLRTLVVWLVLEHMTYQYGRSGIQFQQKVINAADSVVTSQSAASGTIAAPNLYSNATTQLGGDKGTLAGTLSPTGVPTVTAGGSGTTATAQRTIELSVFK
jgi:hypothetical protein